MEPTNLIMPIKKPKGHDPYRVMRAMEAGRAKSEANERKQQEEKIRRTAEKMRIAQENEIIRKEADEKYYRLCIIRQDKWLIENGLRLKKEEEEREKIIEQKRKETEHIESLRNDTYPDIKLEFTIIMTTIFKYSNSVEYEGELHMHSIDVEEDIFVIRKQEKMIVNLPKVFDNYVKDCKENIDLNDPTFIKLFEACKMIFDIYNKPNLGDIEIVSDNIESFLDNYKIIGARIIR